MEAKVFVGVMRIVWLGGANDDALYFFDSRHEASRYTAIVFSFSFRYKVEQVMMRALAHRNWTASSRDIACSVLGRLIAVHVWLAVSQAHVRRPIVTTTMCLHDIGYLRTLTARPFIGVSHPMS